MIERRPIDVAVALGANVGEPWAQIAAAVERLRAAIEIRTVSSVYRTAPVGIIDQPDFLNLVLTGTTSWTVYALQRAAQRIEQELGRVREMRNGPRTIDIDLLSFGDLVLTSPALTLPHPRLHERAFVLGPLSEISPGWRHPVTGESAEQLFSRLPHASAMQRLGPLNGSSPDAGALSNAGDRKG